MTVLSTWLAVVDFKDSEIRRLSGEALLSLALLRAAEAECDRYRTALQQIAGPNVGWAAGQAHSREWAIARDALAKAVGES